MSRRVALIVAVSMREPQSQGLPFPKQYTSLYNHTAVMSRYSDYSRDYDSDEPTEYDRRRNRRNDNRSRSEDSYYSPPRSCNYAETEQSRRHSTGGETKKAAIAVGLLAAVAGLLHLWSNKRKEEEEREYRHRKRRDFENAKAARRKDEEKRFREREQRWKEAPEVRDTPKRIGYAPTRARSRSRMRMIEQNPSTPVEDGYEREDGPRRRYQDAYRERQPG